LFFCGVVYFPSNPKLVYFSQAIGAVHVHRPIIIVPVVVVVVVVVGAMHVVVVRVLARLWILPPTQLGARSLKISMPVSWILAGVVT
jgi:hypothetical protein